MSPDSGYPNFARIRPDGTLDPDLWNRNTSGQIASAGEVLIQNGAAKFDDVLSLQTAAGDTLLEVFVGAAEPTAAAGDTPGTIRLPAGDIINVRNVQGGVFLAGHPALLNLDLGAGSGDATPGDGTGDGLRGNIGMNYDVGAGVLIYDGRAPEGGTLIHQVAAFNQTTDNTNGSALIEFWRPVVSRAKQGNPNDVALNTGIQADAHPRFQLLQNGVMSWGPGGGGVNDTVLYRFAASELKTDAAFDVGGQFTVGGSAQINGYTNIGGTCYAGAFVATSDRRLKDDITPLGGCLDKVLALQPVTFRWAAGSAMDPAPTRLGLVAQDVQHVVPEAVATVEHGDQLGVDYQSLIPLLIGAIDELHSQVGALQARLAAT